MTLFFIKHENTNLFLFIFLTLQHDLLRKENSTSWLSSLDNEVSKEIWLNGTLTTGHESIVEVHTSKKTENLLPF